MVDAIMQHSSSLVHVRDWHIDVRLHVVGVQMMSDIKSFKPFIETLSILYILRYSKLFVKSRELFLTRVYLSSLLAVTPMEFHHDIWHRKTGFPGLLCGVVCVMIMFSLLVTDSQTDSRTDAGP